MFHLKVVESFCHNLCAEESLNKIVIGALVVLVVNQNEQVNSLSVPNHYHFFEDMTRVY